MIEDNLQPSLPSNGFEGSTTNNRVQTDHAEDSNVDTSTQHPKKLKCSSCKEEKEVIEFYISNKYPKRGYEYRCKTCSRRRSLGYHEENREQLCKKWKINRDNLSIEQKAEIAEKSKMYYRQNIVKLLLHRARSRSIKKNIFCNITEEDIILPSVCPLLEIPFQYGSRHDKWLTYSLDRIDNTKGYVKGNVQVITYLANTMKSQATKEQLITFAKNILKLYKDDDIV